MTTRDLAKLKDFAIVVEGEKKTIEKVYCSDLLSWAMGNLPEGGAWCTVMGNINSIAVAHLADAAAIILCEGALLDDDAKQKADEQGITVATTTLPAFDAGVAIAKFSNLLNGN